MESHTYHSLVCQTDWETIFSPQGWESLLGSSNPTATNEYSYTTTWEAMQKAAKEGCSWCQLILLERCTVGEVTIKVAHGNESDCTPKGEKNLRVQLKGSQCGFSECYLIYTTADDPAAKHIKARDRIIDLSTPQSFHLAQECIDACLKTHKDCPQPNLDAPLPDRVIDCSDPTKPRLVLTNRGKHGPYLTLSYVWGGKQPTTKTTNVEDYVENGIPFDILPQTIRDAITVTHSLGQRYLWIDAFCILQDSEEDKAQQLGEMRRIYLNSYLTINAACAATTWDGFLSKVRPQRVPHARVPFRSFDDDSNSVGVVCIAKRYDMDSADATRTYWDELEPINYRGWTLQEKILSPRSLIYARDTLKYYCQTETVGIGGALCEPSRGMRLPRQVYSPEADDERDWTAEEKNKARQAWLSIVFMYTFRRISYADDKLPAVGGVAEQFARVTGDKYLAGLWENSLLFDLLWSMLGVRDDDPKKRRPAKWRAPSWSWASVDGFIDATWLEETAAAVGENLRKAEVVGCWVSPAFEEAPFGEVRSALLRLKAIKVNVIIENGDNSCGGDVMKVGSDGAKTHIGLVTYDADEPRSGEMAVVSLMWDTEGSFVWGLVLEWLPTKHYRRIGNFTDSYKEKQVEVDCWAGA